MFKVNSSHQNDATGVFIVDFEHVLLLFLVFLLLTSNMLLSAGMIAYFVANFFPSEYSQNMSGNNYSSKHLLTTACVDHQKDYRRTRVKYNNKILNKVRLFCRSKLTVYQHIQEFGKLQGCLFFFLFGFSVFFIPHGKNFQFTFFQIIWGLSRPFVCIVLCSPTKYITSQSNISKQPKISIPQHLTHVAATLSKPVMTMMKKMTNSQIAAMMKTEKSMAALKGKS